MIVKTAIFHLISYGGASNREGVSDPDLPELCVGELLIYVLLKSVQRGVLVVPVMDSPVGFLPCSWKSFPDDQS